MKVGEKLFDAIYKVLFLPMSLTENSGKKIIRVIGLLLFFVWFLTIGVLTLPLMLIAMIIEMFENV